jgi:hypothetical protein
MFREIKAAGLPKPNEAQYLDGSPFSTDCMRCGFRTIMGNTAVLLWKKCWAPGSEYSHVEVRMLRGCLDSAGDEAEYEELRAEVDDSYMLRTRVPAEIPECFSYFAEHFVAQHCVNGGSVMSVE